MISPLDVVRDQQYSRSSSMDLSPYSGQSLYPEQPGLCRRSCFWLHTEVTQNINSKSSKCSWQGNLYFSPAKTKNMTSNTSRQSDKCNLGLQYLEMVNTIDSRLTFAQYVGETERKVDSRFNTTKPSQIWRLVSTPRYSQVCTSA